MTDELLWLVSVIFLVAEYDDVDSTKPKLSAGSRKVPLSVAYQSPTAVTRDASDCATSTCPVPPRVSR